MQWLQTLANNTKALSQECSRMNKVYETKHDTSPEFMAQLEARLLEEKMKYTEMCKLAKKMGIDP